MNEQILDKLRFWGVEERHLEIACNTLFTYLNNEYDCDRLQRYLQDFGYITKEQYGTD